MNSTRPRKPLLAVLFVLMALVISVLAAAPLVSARSMNADKVDKKVFTAVDTFLKALPEKGGGNWGLVDTGGLVAQMNSANPPLVVDVRPSGMYAAGHIPGAVSIESTALLDNLDKLGAKDRPIVVYCVSGPVGAQSMMSLSLVGYTNVTSLAGAYNAWVAAGLPIEK